jgi:hypothetical protein
MKIKVALAALALTLAPALAIAGGCEKGHQEASMSCADGTVWNPETKACVVSTS